jgi:hypothetical protein
MKKRRIRRFLLWLLPARKVKIESEPEPTWSGPRPGVEGPRNLGGWSDLPYDIAGGGGGDRDQ